MYIYGSPAGSHSLNVGFMAVARAHGLGGRIGSRPNAAHHPDVKADEQCFAAHQGEELGREHGVCGIDGGGNAYPPMESVGKRDGCPVYGVCNRIADVISIAQTPGEHLLGNGGTVCVLINGAQTAMAYSYYNSEYDDAAKMLHIAGIGGTAVGIIAAL